MQKAQPLSPLPGSWLASPSPYQKRIMDLCALYPDLKRRDLKNRNIPFTDGNAHAALIEFECAASTRGFKTIRRTDFSTASDLGVHLRTAQQSTPPHDIIYRRVYFLEGLGPEYIAVLGGHFDMDPSLFVFQERTNIWNLSGKPVSDEVHLPTWVDDPARELRLKYYEVRVFDTDFDDFALCCFRTGRHIGLTRMYGELSSVGIVRRKCTFWSRKYADGGWDGRLRSRSRANCSQADYLVQLQL